MRLIQSSLAFTITLACFVQIPVSGVASAAFFSVGANQTYLHVQASDTAIDSVPVDLAAEGISPGDVVRIEQVGGVVGVGGGSDNQTSMSAVFSSSSTLTAQANLNRVTGAIDAGIDIVTAPTCGSGEPTDIAEDFRLGGPGSADLPPIDIIVPAGATHLFVGIPDCKLSDNSDPNGDSGFTLDKLVTGPSTKVIVPPNATYLHVQVPGDSAIDTVPIELISLSLTAGDIIKIEQLGDFKGTGAGPDDQKSQLGVFSSSSALTAQANLNRVTGAIDAGADFATGATCGTGEATDISEDFFISGTGATNSPAITIEIPSGATHLFVAVPDCLYADNSDPDGDNAVRITKYGLASVPALSGRSMALMTVVIAATGLVFRRRLR